MAAAVPEPEPVGSPWFQQLVRDGLVTPLTVDDFPEFFDTDEEADEFLEWLYAMRREDTI